MSNSAGLSLWELLSHLMRKELKRRLITFQGVTNRPELGGKCKATSRAVGACSQVPGEFAGGHDFVWLCSLMLSDWMMSVPCFICSLIFYQANLTEKSVPSGRTIDAQRLSPPRVTSIFSLLESRSSAVAEWLEHVHIQGARLRMCRSLESGRLGVRFPTDRWRGFWWKRMKVLRLRPAGPHTRCDAPQHVSPPPHLSRRLRPRSLPRFQSVLLLGSARDWYDMWIGYWYHVVLTEYINKTLTYRYALVYIYICTHTVYTYLFIY